MICGKIELKNFRNCASAEVKFGDGLNIVYGKNAQGKTNLIEGICIFAHGKSFRAVRESELIRFGADSAELKLIYADTANADTANADTAYADTPRADSPPARQKHAEVKYYLNKKRELSRGGLPLEKLSELVGDFRAVLFCPEHLAIIRDGPAARRRFLDIAISQHKPVYLRALQRYAHILLQRNNLLREKYKSGADRYSLGGGFLDSLEVWSAQLAREAAYICRVRENYIRRLAEFAAEFFSDMTGGAENARAAYEPCVPRAAFTDMISADKTSAENPRAEGMFDDAAETEAVFNKLYAGKIRSEIEACGTLYGPHRDDMELLINDRPARRFGSQGQQRSFSLALKLAEGRLCFEDCGEYPVFLLDDVLSELDADRRNFLLSKLEGRQVILTSCEEDIPGAENAVRIEVSGGGYRVR